MAVKFTISADGKQAEAEIKSVVEAFDKLTKEIARSGKASTKAAQETAKLTEEEKAAAKAAKRVAEEEKKASDQRKKADAPRQRVISRLKQTRAELKKMAGLQRKVTAEQKKVGAAGKQSTFKMVTGYAAVAASIVVVRSALRKLTGFVKESIALSGKQQLAEEQRASALRNLGLLTEENIELLDAQAEKLQLLTGAADEDTLAMQGLAVSMGVPIDRLDDFAMAALNAEAAGLTTAESIKRNLIRSLSGMRGELGELVPAIRTLTTAELQAGGAIDVINEQFGGMAEAMMGTWNGAVKAFTNAWGDTREAMGALVTESPTVRAALIETSKLMLETSSAGILSSEAWALSVEIGVNKIIDALEIAGNAFITTQAVFAKGRGLFAGLETAGLDLKLELIRSDLRDAARAGQEAEEAIGGIGTGFISSALNMRVEGVGIIRTVGDLELAEVALEDRLRGASDAIDEQAIKLGRAGDRGEAFAAVMKQLREDIASTAAKLDEAAKNGTALGKRLEEAGDDAEKAQKKFEEMFEGFGDAVRATQKEATDLRLSASERVIAQAEFEAEELRIQLERELASYAFTARQRILLASETERLITAIMAGAQQERIGILLEEAEKSTDALFEAREKAFEKLREKQKEARDEFLRSFEEMREKASTVAEAVGGIVGNLVAAEDKGQAFKRAISQALQLVITQMAQVATAAIANQVSVGATSVATSGATLAASAPAAISKSIETEGAAAAGGSAAAIAAIVGIAAALSAIVGSIGDAGILAQGGSGRTVTIKRNDEILLDPRGTKQFSEQMSMMTDIVRGASGGFVPGGGAGGGQVQLNLTVQSILDGDIVAEHVDFRMADLARSGRSEFLAAGLVTP